MPHIHEKIDFVSNVFIVNGNAVLLRKHDKTRTWLPVGGHVELHEDPTEAAVREAKEEVGLDVSLVGATQIDPRESTYASAGGHDLLMPFFMNRHWISETHEHISFEYFATSETREFSQGESEISEDIQWFTNDMLDDPSFGIPEVIVSYAKKALEVLGN